MSNIDDMNFMHSGADSVLEGLRPPPEILVVYRAKKKRFFYAHTHTYIYIYTHICMYKMIISVRHLPGIFQSLCLCVRIRISEYLMLNSFLNKGFFNVLYLPNF